MSDKFCGSTIPAPITITNGNVSIIFRSDFSTTLPGFELNHTCMPETTPVSPTTSSPTTPTPTPYHCGGELSDEYGLITSPAFPEDYPPNTVCTWTMSCNGTIELVVNSFEIEYNSKC